MKGTCEYEIESRQCYEHGDPSQERGSGNGEASTHENESWQCGDPHQKRGSGGGEATTHVTKQASDREAAAE